jgi:hypothetical protein
MTVGLGEGIDPMSKKPVKAHIYLVSAWVPSYDEEVVVAAFHDKEKAEAFKVVCATSADEQGLLDGNVSPNAPRCWTSSLQTQIKVGSQGIDFYVSGPYPLIDHLSPSFFSSTIQPKSRS